MVDKRIYMRIMPSMRRKPGTLIPIEVSILSAGLSLLRIGQDEFHGYAIAREIRDIEAARKLAAQGTLYRALDRLEAQGMLESRLEDAEAAALESRPRRRLYRVTAQGEAAVASVVLTRPSGVSELRRGEATT
jgi:PadR family transcriptional regulator PadR